MAPIRRPARDSLPLHRGRGPFRVPRVRLHRRGHPLPPNPPRLPEQRGGDGGAAPGGGHHGRGAGVEQEGQGEADPGRRGLPRILRGTHPHRRRPVHPAPDPPGGHGRLPRDRRGRVRLPRRAGDQGDGHPTRAAPPRRQGQVHLRLHGQERGREGQRRGVHGVVRGRGDEGGDQELLPPEDAADLRRDRHGHVGIHRPAGARGRHRPPRPGIFGEEDRRNFRGDGRERGREDSARRVRGVDGQGDGRHGISEDALGVVGLGRDRLVARQAGRRSLPGMRRIRAELRRRISVTYPYLSFDECVLMHRLVFFSSSPS
mmetsp:Transcript_28038/g.59557  ORF Transcript_28038/g.59557 Transcript_28038/m.59557 type:complete len:316 (-) Transcript_28038:287-1234(-)